MRRRRSWANWMTEISISITSAFFRRFIWHFHDLSVNHCITDYFTKFKHTVLFKYKNSAATSGLHTPLCTLAGMGWMDGTEPNNCNNGKTKTTLYNTVWPTTPKILLYPIKLPKNPCSTLNAPLRNSVTGRGQNQPGPHLPPRSWGMPKIKGCGRPKLPRFRAHKFNRRKLGPRVWRLWMGDGAFVGLLTVGLN